MTPSDRDFDDLLGQVLHAAVDPIEPAGDGLDKIRRRLSEPWLLRQFRLLVTECEGLAWLALVRLEPAAAQARSHLAAYAGSARTSLNQVREQVPELGRLVSRISGSPRYDAAHRSQAIGQDGSPLRAVLSRLRPVLAVAGAVVIVVAGVFGLTQLRATISDIGLITPGANVSTPSHPAASPTPTGHSHSHRRHRSTGPSPTSAVPVPAPVLTPSPTASCTKAPTPTASPTPSGSATSAPASPSPTPSGTTTPASPSPAAAISSAGTSSPSPSAAAGSPQALSATSLGATQARQRCG